MRKNQFTLDNFTSLVDKILDLGMDRLIREIPGMSEAAATMKMGGAEMDAQFNRMRAIFRSMAREERRNTGLLDDRRRRRIAHGAGVELSEVVGFVKQFETTRELMRRW